MSTTTAHYGLVDQLVTFARSHRRPIRVMPAGEDEWDIEISIRGISDAEELAVIALGFYAVVDPGGTEQRLQRVDERVSRR